MGKEPQHHRWLLYLLMGVLLQFMMLPLSMYIPPEAGFENLAFLLFTVCLFGGMGITAIMWLVGFWAYHKDGQALAQRNGAFPRTGLYIAAHMFIPPIAAIVYLLQRGKYVGNDYSETLAAKIPGVGMFE